MQEGKIYLHYVLSLSIVDIQNILPKILLLKGLSFVQGTGIPTIGN